MDKRILLHSFPRSGNHLVRAFLELLTGFPTQGCPGAFKDRPILQSGLYTKYKLRKFLGNNLKEFIQSKILDYISKKYYIAYKSHYDREFYINKKAVLSVGAKPLPIFLFRAPESALISHFTRSYYLGVNNLEEANIWFEEAISCYEESLNLCYKIISSGSEFVVLNFDSLLENDSLTEWHKIYELILKMDSVSIPNIDHLHSLVKVSKLLARRASPTSAAIMKPLPKDFVQVVISSYKIRINDLNLKYRKLF